MTNLLSQSRFSAPAPSFFYLSGYYGSLGNQRLDIALPIKITINFQRWHVRISVRMYKISQENKHERNAI